jgi:TetR/AcrR family transcriptional regulator, mexJK operon transcriptional repressor
MIESPVRSGGRPTAAAAALLEPAILDHATAAFLRDGYAATSLEAIARQAHVAKRTIYARWDGKAALFLAVVRRLIATWLASGGAWTEAGGLEASLRAAARAILSVALTPEAIALRRLMIAEGTRFPELNAIVHQAGADEGVRRIAAFLLRAVAEGQLRPLNVGIAAEQFLHLVLGGPQQRALSGGPLMTEDETEAWCDAAVRLFLSGVLAAGAPASQREHAKAAGKH